MPPAAAWRCPWLAGGPLSSLPDRLAVGRGGSPRGFQAETGPPILDTLADVTAT